MSIPLTNTIDLYIICYCHLTKLKFPPYYAAQHKAIKNSCHYRESEYTGHNRTCGYIYIFQVQFCHNRSCFRGKWWAFHNFSSTAKEDCENTNMQQSSPRCMGPMRYWQHKLCKTNMLHYFLLLFATYSRRRKCIQILIWCNFQVLMENYTTNTLLEKF